MATKAATLGDPRRPGEVRRMTTLPAVPDDTVSQVILITAMCSGVMGLMLQSKAVVWLGLITSLAGYSHMPFDAPESKRMMMFVFTMVVWAFTQVYFKPFLTAPRAAQAASSSRPQPSLVIEDD